VLASIAAFVPGCFASSSIDGCDPPEKDISIEGDLTEAEADQLVMSYELASADAIDCETACTLIFERDEEWELGEVKTCSGEVSSMRDPDPEAIAGVFSCDVHAFEYYCEGRRPAGHVELVADGNGLAKHLAHCAHLEAAAVTAFADLVETLERWQAPVELIARCRRARAQEIEHARDVGAMAMRYGATLTAPTRERRELARVELAIDNAIEGCVHEAWAALRAQWMSEHAHDAALRAMYTNIAADEIEHAQLSWDLHAWLLDGLDADDRERVEAALRGALDRLPDVAATQASTSPRVLGLPDAQTSFALARDFRDRLAAA
jgi:hypothetical protein